MDNVIATLVKSIVVYTAAYWMNLLIITVVSSKYLVQRLFCLIEWSLFHKALIYICKSHLCCGSCHSKLIPMLNSKPYSRMGSRQSQDTRSYLQELRIYIYICNVRAVFSEWRMNPQSITPQVERKKFQDEKAICVVYNFGIFTVVDSKHSNLWDKC